MGSKAPKAPDPMKVSAAQTQSNKDTAAYNASLNRIDQSGPFGSITYQTNGTDPTTGAPLYTQNTSLSPQLQGLLDSQIGAQQGISSAITGALGNLPQGPFDPNIDVGDIRQRSFDSQMALLAPQFDQGFKQLEGRMSDRGIPIGSEIFNDQQGEYNRARDTSLLAAARQADQDASNEYQRQFGNQLTQYNLPLQQLQGLMGTSSPVQNPSFSPFAQSSSQPTDVAGNIWNKYQTDVNNYNSQQSNMFGGLLGLGKLGLGAYSAGLFG